MQLKKPTEKFIKEYTCSVGSRIRDRRKKMKLSVEDMMGRMASLGAPVAKTTISGWESGYRAVNVGMLPVVAATLDCSPESLLSKTVKVRDRLKVPNWN